MQNLAKSSPPSWHTICRRHCWSILILFPNMRRNFVIYNRPTCVISTRLWSSPPCILSEIEMCWKWDCNSVKKMLSSNNWILPIGHPLHPRAIKGVYDVCSIQYITSPKVGHTSLLHPKYLTCHFTCNHEYTCTINIFSEIAQNLA